MAPGSGTFPGVLGTTSEGASRGHTVVTTVAFITADTVQFKVYVRGQGESEVYRRSTGIKNQNDETSLAAQKI